MGEGGPVPVFHLLRKFPGFLEGIMRRREEAEYKRQPQFGISPTRVFLRVCACLGIEGEKGRVREREINSLTETSWYIPPGDLIRSGR